MIAMLSRTELIVKFYPACQGVFGNLACIEIECCQSSSNDDLSLKINAFELLPVNE